ncbi:hypothetical protein LTS17_000985 [Exophiala oligosperma]
MANEQTPLLGSFAYGDSDEYPPPPATSVVVVDPHEQFCMMVGVPSSAPPDADEQNQNRKRQSVPKKSLYGRVTRQLAHQRWTYYTTASLSNTMLLTQVVLGAALTALGASESSHVLITVFGAMNTVIAGLVAYLKSRGQPMRARMYRDDLERVVDEIENSEVMWLGISRHVHGYDEIDTDDGQVSVRSEVARLTRLYDRAVKNNTMNNPDMYMGNGGGYYDGNGAQLRSRPAVPTVLPALPIAAGPQQPVVAAPAVQQPNLPPPPPQQQQPAPAPPVQNVPDPDESPATAPPKPKEEPKKVDDEVKKDEDKKEKANGDGGGGGGGDDTKKEEEKGKESPKKDGDNKQGESSSSSSSPSAPESADPSPAKESSSSQPQPPPPTPPPQTQAQAPAAYDPDAAPASDPNVPLKKD